MDDPERRGVGRALSVLRASLERAWAALASARDWRALRLGCAVVLAVSALGMAGSPAEAAFVFTRSTTLVFAGGIISADQPDLARNVTATQSGGSLVIENVGDVIAVPMEDAVRCPYLDTSTFESVACDLTGIGDINVITGNGADRIAVSTTLPTALCGGRGDDVITGGPGVDVLAGAGGSDALSGGPNDDFLRADHVPGFAATDPTCNALAGDPPGSNTLDGGPGKDLLVGDDGSDTLRGGLDDDVAFGRPGDDSLDGGDGNDLLVGLDGADALDGGAGRDVLSGGAGPDRVLGGPDNDELGLPVLLTVDRGGPVEGSTEAGDDLFDGQADDDTLFAGPGERTVNYGLDPLQRAGGRTEPNGADTLTGGTGRDEVSYVNREIPVSVSLNGRADDGSPGEGDDVASDVERVTGGTSNDVLSGGPGNDALDGGLGSDTITGLDGADVLEGSSADAGADELDGGGGPDTLTGGPGADHLVGASGNDSLHGGGGNDRLSGGAGDDDVAGEADVDDVAGGPGADVLDGGAGIDVANYTSATRAVTVSLDERRNDGEAAEDWVRQMEGVLGGPGADTLFGNAAANTLSGGPGDDLIDSGAGTDTISAGDGRDAVRARDAIRDAVGCGAGVDLAIVDEEDSLRSGGERCERRENGGRRRGEALLRPAACRLAVRFPRMARTVPVAEALSIPRRANVDVTRCAANLSTGRRGPRVRARGGTFTLRRVGSRRRAVELQLDGADFASCAHAPASRRIRALTVRTDGSSTLFARHAFAAGRNATWTMEDRCRSTVTRVRSGSVRVTDLPARRVVTVRAGHAHVSQQRPRPG